VRAEEDFNGRGAVVLLLVHTLLMVAVGYYFGYLGGVDEGTCRSTCEEATAGQGNGHITEQGCTCTVISINGATTTWTEELGSTP
jgi:hypothetical protein